MKNATFPHCPLNGCAGTVVYAYSIGKGDYETKFYRCPMCGELMRGRKPTDAEKAQKRAEKAAKKAKKTQKQILEELRAERERLAKMPQKPVIPGLDPMEWFFGLRNGEYEQVELRQGMMEL